MAYDEDLAHRVRELLADEDGLTEMRSTTARSEDKPAPRTGPHPDVHAFR